MSVQIECGMESDNFTRQKSIYCQQKHTKTFIPISHIDVIYHFYTSLFLVRHKSVHRLVDSSSRSHISRPLHWCMTYRRNTAKEEMPTVRQTIRQFRNAMTYQFTLAVQRSQYELITLIYPISISRCITHRPYPLHLCRNTLIADNYNKKSVHGRWRDAQPKSLQFCNKINFHRQRRLRSNDKTETSMGHSSPNCNRKQTRQSTS